MLLTGWLVPLILFVMKKDESPFVREHGRQALNFSLTLLIVNVGLTVVLTIITIVTLGIGGVLFLLCLVPPILQIVFGIMQAVAANRGEGYRYPLTIQMVK